MEKAVSLNPKDWWSLQNLTHNYTMVRDFAKANQTIDRALVANPAKLGSWEIKFKLAIAEKGDFSVAEKAFEALKSFPMTNAQKLNIASRRVDVFLLERKYSEGLNEAESLPDDQLAAYPDYLWSKYYGTGFARKGLHDEPGARVAFLKAKGIAKENLKRSPDSEDAHLQLAKALAQLGEKEAALAEAQHASELLPASNDAFGGAEIAAGVAEVYAILGDNDRVIDVLDGLLTRPSGVTAQGLKVNPIWDPLRANPAFQKLCQQKQP
jgi:tetratricopeptide (TPR) repeat protein